MKKILVDVEATCVMLSIARTTLYAEVRLGRIVPIKRGKRTFFHQEEIERYVADLPKPAASRR
jgi:hypothetical protein